MRNLIGLLFVSVLLSFSHSASAGQYEDGTAAYDRKDYATALRLWRPLADRGDARALLKLGEMYWFGRGVTRDDVQAYMWTNLARARSYMEEGDHRTRAISFLGAIHGAMRKQYDDWLIAEANRRAVAWKPNIEGKSDLKKAAPLGGASYEDAEAAWKSAKNYAEYERALELMMALAGKGDTRAQRFIGFQYEYGQSVPKSAAEAAVWYRKAADQGDPLSHFRLGEVYSVPAKWGDDVPPDFEVAAKHFRFAADRGLPNAQEALGDLYKSGEGVLEDYSEAAKWYRRAAEQGESTAQYKIGRMYESGQGSARDLVQAHKWFNLAAAAPNPPAFSDQWWVKKEASDSRTRITRLMTSAQIAEAQKLARQWKPKLEK